MRPSSKTAKGKTNKDIVRMDDVGKEAKSIIEKILGDVSKTSATKQLLLGTSSGWVTGFLAMRVGKTAALALGSGIILVQIANEKGYIKINWDKVNKNIDNITDKVEETITGETSTFMDKVMKFARKSTSFTTGFIGGFLIGLGSR
ncbi:FUN14 domain-containing protein 1 isoform X2 [Anoplophora glabripennis]|uniref:FUN14 domain-containing protein 1 isoform X2 n=1 Tax=Anoplophora glabripennis TaxID=217634 RepID=UPI0008758EE9|nr:FUN14 domain-containing protein 1 isoform X2 [Anoplophora glabripennis]